MVEILPSIKVVEALHHKYAPNEAVFDLVWTHCRIVGDIALQLATTSKIGLDVELVMVGCLLHDIGVYSLYDNNGFQTNPKEYITHGVRGEDLLKAEGFTELLYRFASHHTGAGITKKQIIENDLPLPHQDWLAETTEEKLVMYADKFHSKTEPPYFNTYEFYADYVTRFGREVVDSFASLTALFGKPDLEPIISKYNHAVRDKVDTDND